MASDRLDAVYQEGELRTAGRRVVVVFAVDVSKVVKGEVLTDRGRLCGEGLELEAPDTVATRKGQDDARKRSWCHQTVFPG